MVTCNIKPHLLVAHVVHALLERDVDRVVAAGLRPDLVHVARPREEVAVAVQGDGHDAVGEVEGLLHAVAVVDVDVDVQDARVYLEMKYVQQCVIQ